MYAMRFDDLRRKMLTKSPPVELRKLTTAIQNTPDYDTYMGLFLMPENEAIHVTVEADDKTYTFYTIHKIEQKEEVHHG